MRLFERQTYDFHWWTLIWGKRIYPLTRAVYFLECPLIRDFTAFVSFPFSHAWAGHQCRISRTTSLPAFVVPNLALFCISESKIVRWQQDHIHNFIISTKYLIRVSFSQTIRKWAHENIGNLSNSVSISSATLPQLSSRTSRGIGKCFYLSPLINSWLFIFYRN